MTALHAVCEYGAPLQVVEALVHVYPDALEMKDWRGYTPADIALTDECKQYLATVEINKDITKGSKEEIKANKTVQEIYLGTEQ